MRFATLTALMLALSCVPAAAQDKPAAPAADIIPQVKVTRHSGTFGGQRVNYVATIGETILKGDDGTPKASIVTTSYVKEPRDPNRPVTFLFNGGPGSGIVWLMMGAFGPKRVAIPSDARDDGSPPYPILDNPDSLLDVTDIVFIDPPGAGYSRILGKTEPKEFYGVTADARAVAEVIRRSRVIAVCRRWRVLHQRERDLVASIVHLEEQGAVALGQVDGLQDVHLRG